MIEQYTITKLLHPGLLMKWPPDL